jgi:hypothetical protein
MTSDTWEPLGLWTKSDKTSSQLKITCELFENHREFIVEIFADY